LQPVVEKVETNSMFQHFNSWVMFCCVPLELALERFQLLVAIAAILIEG
jgi:hypothetical protein